ncbi:MAG: DUF424 family protein [Candidatus Hadarchaeales archaeon]
MPLLRKLNHGGERLVIICDRELLGRKFKCGELKLEVKESFYGGEEASVQECLRALEEATIGNMVGSIVDEAIKAGIIDGRNVIRFEGVPHAQLVRL